MGEEGGVCGRDLPSHGAWEPAGHTLVDNGWLSGRLAMGARTAVSRTMGQAREYIQKPTARPRPLLDALKA
jgi:hypothetical protein